MRRWPAVPAALVAAAALSAPAHAATWTEVPSNTAEDITAIEYQGPDRFWFTTGAGKIFQRVGGSFVQRDTLPGTVLKDIEFQPGGNVGLAVGTNGVVRRSTDGGATWGAALLPAGGSRTSETNCGATETPGDLDSVRFEGARAYVAGSGSQLYVSLPGAPSAVGSTGTWQWRNNGPGTDCRLPRDIDDIFPVPGSDSAYFIAKSFGQVYFSSDFLASTAAEKPGDAGNGFQRTRRVAGDPVNPNRMWAVTPDGEGGSYYSRTTDGWSTSQSWGLGNLDEGDLTRGESLDFGGGTLVAAGSAGMILVSNDGGTFYRAPAGGALTTRDWRAVGVASGTQAAVGGVGGSLVVSDDASTIPDVIPPAGAITGPITVTAGQPATFTAIVADNAGGSGINPGSFSWTASGVPAATGNPAALTFPSAGGYTVRVRFTDNAGNPGEASLSVIAGPPARPAPPTPPARPVPATKTISASVPGGGTVALKAPRRCVRAGTSFSTTLSFKRSKRRGAVVIKVTKVDFSIDGKRKKLDKKAPFVQRLTIKGLKAGTKHTLRARAFLKVRRGKSPSRSIRTTFTVCP